MHGANSNQLMYFATSNTVAILFTVLYVKYIVNLGYCNQSYTSALFGVSLCFTVLFLDLEAAIVERHAFFRNNPVRAYTSRKADSCIMPWSFKVRKLA